MKQKPEGEYRYKRVFMPGTMMRVRLDSIMIGEGDPYPGGSGCEEVERFMIALTKGEAPPDAMVSDDGGKRRTPRKAKDYGLVIPVAEALLELF